MSAAPHRGAKHSARRAAQHESRTTRSVRSAVDAAGACRWAWVGELAPVTTKLPNNPGSASSIYPVRFRGRPAT